MLIFSMCLAFLVFGTIANVLCNFFDGLAESRKEEPLWFWFIVAMAAIGWVIVVPASFLVLLIYLLKLLTDWISQYILKKIKNRKDKKCD
jgi:hypothetical protein